MAIARENRDLGSNPRGPETAPASLPDKARVGFVVSTYHRDLTGAMAESAREVLVAAGHDPERILELTAPGAFELPLIARELARRDDVQAVLAFGLILKGETDHDRYIGAAVAQGLMQAGLETKTPVLFGVLTCNTLEQAQARARRSADGGLDKGREVALAAIETLRSLERAHGGEGAVGDAG